jgi:hypothetical protein
VLAFGALQLPAANPGAPLYFTRHEFALLDTLTELIIPTDEHSPGAHVAGVAAYIDRTAAEAFLPEDKLSWRNGLAAVDKLSSEQFSTPFVKATKDQQTQLLTKLAAAEKDPKTEAEKFWTQLKDSTAFAYYSSAVGIHQDIEYKGNVILEKFVGYEP